jgi:hypothetical protein
MSRRLVWSMLLMLLIGTSGSLLKVQKVEAGPARSAGVSIGDWWRYEVSFTWLTTPHPSYWCELANNTDWLKCDVLDVSGVNVTCQQLYHLNNGTERDVIGLIDVASGASNASNSYMICPYIVVSANLTIGEPIFTDVLPYNQWKINATESRTYAGTPIETNLANISSQYSIVTLYFSKYTGTLLEFEITVYDDYYVRALVVENPVVPEFPSFFILPLFIVATLLAATVYKRKRVT